MQFDEAKKLLREVCWLPAGSSNTKFREHNFAAPIQRAAVPQAPQRCGLSPLSKPQTRCLFSSFLALACFIQAILAADSWMST